MFALASAVLFGTADFIGGFATRRLPAWTVALWTQLFGLPVLVVGALVVNAPEVTGNDLRWGASAGIVGIAGLAILYATLAAGQMSVVAPIIGSVAAVIPVGFAVVVGETINAVQWGGIALAVGAVMLLGRDPDAGPLNRKLLLQAIAAATAFGVFFVLMGQTSADSGVWPLIAARTISVPFGIGVVLLAATVNPRTPRRTWGLVALSGAVDMAANIAILLAVQRGPIGINAVLGSLYPVFTVAAAIVVLRERPSRNQSFGIVLAVVAIAALAI
jgi:drug/metabolite transporter (DMT)-like permease